MDPAAYDAWYDTPRGRWIGQTEHRLLADLLAPRKGETLLDVGCGTGWFTRRLAAAGLAATGVDVDREALAFARSRPGAPVRYLEGDARRLPFPDASFDLVVSVTALCFVDDWREALAEVARVARRRFAVGLLNRHGLLWREKGRDGGQGAYRGARWHEARELREALRALRVTDVMVRSAVFLPSAGRLARALEPLVPAALPLGSFIAVGASPRRGATLAGAG
jgi:SAM-dependent methyltransferase